MRARHVRFKDEERRVGPSTLTSADALTSVQIDGEMFGH